jgi:cellulose synthase/poly-beta-1,6-N-acetylglucosamine synthase-like glycosyltransferase
MDAIELGLVVFVTGSAIVAIANLWLWRRDKYLALRLAAERRALAVPQTWPPTAPQVTFLIAAWNEHDILPRSLGSILALSYPDIEIIVCAGGDDRTLALAQHFECERPGRRVLVLEQFEGEGKQRALGRCFAKATGQIIYLTDADCVIDDTTFGLCVRPIVEGQERAVTGSFYFPLPEQLGEAFISAHMAVLAYTAAGHPPYSTGLLGGNCVIQRGALEAAGGFPSDVRTGTDYDLAKRLLNTGVRIRYQVHASIASEFPRSVSAYAQQQTRWIRNVVMYGLRYQAYSEVLACLRTSLIGLVMLAGPVVWLAIAAWFGLLSLQALLVACGWAVVFLHALLARMRYQRFAEYWLNTPRYAWLIGWQAAFLWLDFAVWSVPLLEYPIQSRRERW